MKTIDITKPDCKYNIVDLEVNDYLITSIGKFIVTGKSKGKIVCKRIKQ